MAETRLDTSIWHYFDFAKFVSLLESRSLFFSSAGALEDPFEGALPLANVRENSLLPEPDEETRRICRDLVLVHSWHANDHESFAMWRLYSKAPEAVAIQTTIGELKESLSVEKRWPIRVEGVQYIDYARDCIEERNTASHLSPYVCKAKPFSYENEVRAIIDLYGANESPEELRRALREVQRFEHGMYARVNVEKLLKAVYVSPSAGRWFLDLVTQVLKRYGIPGKPRHSVLASEPNY